ncbi:MAG: ribulose-phosphate 3-epimerase [Actinobacteria bacterium]|uniref:ribulose-phosphate 3-epimerase n=1 Tax=freshwater metagenome TaxID=449393 RepID=A0A6J7CHX6_9ZZZZ|nr:ribulose-phosphate 3-epimerase [Actinomycetota bacterium]
MSREIRITPSILNADLGNLSFEIGRIAAQSDLIHLDVMDNVFVPNFTFDFEQASQIVNSCPIPVDAHLMVADVDEIAATYAEIGCASVTIHAEAVKNVGSTLRSIRNAGARAGLGIKPGTKIDDYAEFIDDIDMFLIMTVEPGFGGQSFMHEMMDKVRRTRSIIGDRPIWLQVDGGVSIDTIAEAAQAGADVFVAGSAVFKSDNPAEMVNSLRILANSAAN